jgi:glyoxylase-like metal-dependent hydrolase (beta-lactamase superfamily II)
MKAYAIEGNRQRLDGGAMFGNVPKALWQKWMTPDESNCIEIACRSLLVQTDDGRNILFDAGVGTFFEPKLRERYGIFEEEHRLLANLSVLGIREDQIDAIILSHLHFDHAGGILSPYSEKTPPYLLFPNAKYFVGKEQWERALQPHPRDRASFIPELQNLLEDSGRLILVDQEEQLKNEYGISVKFLHGHTVGLMVSELITLNGSLFVISDLIPGLPWIHLPVTMGYDRFPELLIDEKKAVLERAVKEKSKLFFTHDPAVSCAFVEKNDKGHYFGVPTVI